MHDRYIYSTVWVGKIKLDPKFEIGGTHRPRAHALHRSPTSGGDAPSNEDSPPLYGVSIGVLLRKLCVPPISKTMPRHNGKRKGFQGDFTTAVAGGNRQHRPVGWTRNCPTSCDSTEGCRVFPSIVATRLAARVLQNVVLVSLCGKFLWVSSMRNRLLGANFKLTHAIT